MKRRNLPFLTYVLLLLIAPISDVRSCAKQQLEPIASQAPLTGKKWRLIEVNGTAVTSNKPAPRRPAGQPYIQFGPKVNRYSGSGGCNGFGGDYTTDGSHIKFSQPISTAMRCVDNEAQNVENDFLKGLDKVTDFEVEGDLLRLLKDGHSILAFKAAPTGTPNSR
jgi:heat shock protein HslJ